MGWLISANLNAKVIIKLETDKKIDKKIDKKMANDIIKNYMRYLKLERNYSLNTLEAYRHDLDYLMEYARNNDKGVLEMKLEDLENFSASLHDKGISATSHARVLCGVRSFYRYLVIDDYLKDDPTELLPSPQIGEHLPEYLEMGGTAQQGYHRNPVFLRVARVGTGDPEDQSGLRGGEVHPGDGKGQEGEAGSHLGKGAEGN